MTSDNTATATMREAFLNRSAVQIRYLGRRAAQDIVEIGKLLTMCKTTLDHGEWLPWIEREFGWSDRTARNFMNVHRMLASKSEIISDLNIDATALYALAAKSTPNSVREQILARARQGEHISPRTLNVTVRSPPPSGTRTIVPVYDTPTPRPTIKPADPPFASTTISSDQMRDGFKNSYNADDLQRSEIDALANRIVARERVEAGFWQRLVDKVTEKIGAPPTLLN